MPNRVNELLIREYTDRYRDVSNLIAVGYPGLDIEKTNQLRGTLADANIRLKVVKNRLARLAFKDLGWPDIDPILEGQTAFADGEDPVAVARTLVDFRKENKQLQIHGGLVESTVLDAKQIEDLSKSPTKEELKGQIAGMALSPGANLSGALLGTGGQIASQIDKLVEMKEGDAA